VAFFQNYLKDCSIAFQSKFKLPSAYEKS
jgi:hypothetical protein